MARFGIPMYKPSQTAHVWVTIEFPDGKIKMVKWRSRGGFYSIRRAAKAAYPGARLSFGRVMWITD